ncbi:MAG: glycosyltransferase family 2 protein [Bacilli bacterium]|nr:glycosyltransferase family 2 protein [Bacilli bacterium]
MHEIAIFFENIIISIGNIYRDSKSIYDTFGSILAIMLAYKTFYIVIGLFFTRKFKKTNNKHKYGIVIAARNEEKVIGNLLDSIKKQDYPMKFITIFVVADNCTDNTAKIAREHGAICYERFNDKDKTKGFALQFLFKNIEKDYGTQSFEGFFVFDADNLLQKDYITRMNESFDSGEKIITSYRNTKNFSENWIASIYALHWLRSVRTNHRPRSVFRLATNIQGTGFLFHSEIVRNGWKYTSLTEDRALTADAVSQGYRISFNNEAMFYDEQPINLKIALRQRLRWSRGHLLAFLESGPKLFLNIFFGKLFVKLNWSGEKKENKKVTFKGLILNIIESIRHRFASYDTLLQLTPIVLINLIRWLIVSFFIYSCYCYTNGINNAMLIGKSTYLLKLIGSFANININISPGINSLLMGFLLSFIWRALYRIGVYFENIWMAIYIFIVEHKKIIPISFWKKVLYCFTWPIFDIIGRYTTYIAVFKNVTWKPIPHESKVTIQDINKSKKML